MGRDKLYAVKNIENFLVNVEKRQTESYGKPPPEIRSAASGRTRRWAFPWKSGTAADVVIHYDPWWNQAAQDQATDRAHRMGQQAHVQVYKLIAKGTIEEKILELQEKKAALMDTVAGAEDTGILNMSQEDLLALLDER